MTKVVPKINSASEAIALLTMVKTEACRYKRATYVRAEVIKVVIDWIQEREKLIDDIERGAAFLMLQAANEVGRRKR